MDIGNDRYGEENRSCAFDSKDYAKFGMNVEYVFAFAVDLVE